MRIVMVGRRGGESGHVFELLEAEQEQGSRPGKGKGGPREILSSKLNKSQFLLLFLLMLFLLKKKCKFFIYTFSFLFQTILAFCIRQGLSYSGGFTATCCIF